MLKIISKDKVEALLGTLSEYEIYVPTEQSGVVSYSLYDKEHFGDEHGDKEYFDKGFLSDFSNSKKPPKDVFFPQTEKMFDFEVEGMKVTGVKDPEFPDTRLLLFGTRPCDAAAMDILDTVFNWDYIDPYYMNRRKHATIISLCCTRPCDSCFCTSMGGSPGSSSGSDMLWTDLGDRYLVESISEKGDRILELCGGSLFTDAEEADETAAKAVVKQAEDRILRTLELDGVRDALEHAFESDYWEDFARRCMGCGICTLLCPTCHCFDINDIISKDKACRERTWDTCQSSYYSVHASGHNPRPEKSHRQRNRIYHKFVYMDKNLGVVGCVGCGRCITGCPVNIDIIEVVEGVKDIDRVKDNEEV